MRLLRKEACYCRLSPADKDGAIRHVLYANWRQSVSRREDIEVIDLLDINTPWRDLANLCGFTDHRWANYLGLRTKAIDIEQRIAEEFISPEQLAVFRDEVFAMSWDFSCEPSAMPNPFEHCQGDAENGGEHFSLTQRSHAQVIERLRSIVVAALQGNALNVPSLRDIVDYMRKHDALFPEFRQSATYKLFEPPIFENKKKSHGYFF